MFSASCRNAIRAVIYLAIHSDEENKLGVEDIASALDISRHFLAKSLQLLAKNDFVSSIRGPKGGFFLSEENRRAKLLSIISCMDGPQIVDKCVLGLSDCSNDNPCPFHMHMSEFRSGLNEFLLGQTIGEVASKIENDKIRF